MISRVVITILNSIIKKSGFNVKKGTLMEMQQNTFDIGIIFWPTLALMYAGLIAAGVWVIWG